jgi:hypothetical protein
MEVVAEALVASAPRDQVEAAARRAARRPHLVATDCMSYASEGKMIVHRVTGVSARRHTCGIHRAVCRIAGLFGEAPRHPRLTHGGPL